MSNKSEDPAKRNGKANPASSEPKSRAQDKDYEVGYGKPPKHTRFVKGRSGNPRGRPGKKKPQPLKLSDAPSDFFLETEAYRSIALRENGEGIELPATQVVLRALVTGAMKGNRLSQKYFLKHVARLEELHFKRKMEHYHRLATLKRQGEQTLADCEEQGLPPPDLLPHPDDIVLHPSTGEAFIDGPETPEDVCYYEHTKRLRDFGLLLSAHADKTGKGLKIRHEGKTLCVYLLLADILDRTLPRRYRWQKSAPVSLMMEYLNLTLRERERRIAAEFAELDTTKPRLTLLTPEMEEEIDRIVRRYLTKRADPPAAHSTGI